MISIISPKTKEQFKSYYTLRFKVLSEPAGHPRGTEKDDYEPISEHFMAVDDSGNVIGAVKLYEKNSETGHFSHLVVDPHFQRQGIGKLLLAHIEKRAREKGYSVLGTTSRVTATAYFEKAGYHIAGLPALHLGTMQMVWMEKKLD